MWTLEAGGSQLVFCVLIAAFCMEHALQQRVQQLKGEYDDLISRISELESERAEHQLVLMSLEKLEPTRRCWRLVGGILVERTVGEVMPAVQTNMKGIEQVLVNLKEQVEKIDQEIGAIAAKYRIQRSQQKSERKAEPAEKPKSGTPGVLV